RNRVKRKRSGIVVGMSRIPAGWFWMGSEGRYEWEGPRHRVFVDEFDIAATPVTCEEYARFLVETQHEPPRGWNDPLFADPEQPVVGVSWFDAQTYCAWLSTLAGEPYRLPSEAEWEKACRGGCEFEYAWGDQPPESFEYFRGAWRAPRVVGQW